LTMTKTQLRNQLSSIEPNEKTFAGIDLTDIPLLEELLHDEEAWMASRAVFALSKLTDNQAITVLSKAATDPRPEVRVSIAAITQNLQPKDANPLLINLLTDSDIGVRKFAIQAVSQKHDVTIHSKLNELESEDPAQMIRELATKKIKEILK
jgi:HEAT repeat protein